MTDAQDPIEDRLTRDLHALVDGERAPADIAERADALVGGLHRARRRRRAVAIGAMAAVSAVIGGVAWAALADDEGERAIRTADDGTTTTTEVDGTSTTDASTTTSTSTSTTEPGVAPPVPPPPVAEPPPTPTTVDDPPERRCAAATGEPSPARDYWLDYYQAEPEVDQAASVRICIDDISPRVGQLVTITLVGDDPDAGIFDAECGWHVRWDDSAPGLLCRDFMLPPPDSPLPLPVPEVGHIERTATHRYEAAGAVTLAGLVASGEYEGYPVPHGSYVRAELTVVVHG